MRQWGFPKAPPLRRGDPAGSATAGSSSAATESEDNRDNNHRQQTAAAGGAESDNTRHGSSERELSPGEQNGESALVSNLLYGANIEMVKIDAIREANARAKQIGTFVAVFVGGTGGIGESTAKELFARTTRPKAYIIGRLVEPPFEDDPPRQPQAQSDHSGRHHEDGDATENGIDELTRRSEEKGNAVVNALREINPDGEAICIQKDVSLLRNVDDLCEELKQREEKINCLFLTAGYMTLKGRTETIEGMDRKMCVNYYSRVRWMLNLMPLLTAASERNELSRVISVLAAGSEGEIRTDDLDLKHNFTLHACLAHCVVMTDFAIEEMARRYPGTAFSHSYPGTVKTGIANELSGPVRLAVKVMYAVMTPWILNVQESGERHFFQMTNACYPAASGGSAGVPLPEGLGVMKGSDGRVGSGAYLLDWDGKAIGDESVLRKYRELGMRQKVWDHTMGVFEQAMRLNPKHPKRPATSEPEGSGRPIPNPIGWRPG
jgi:NAD(P)-dependent dehydrogenase (short-subunit alcohol dehydrogenase family)